nr:MDIS1-interacting receptor like kinase 2-like [Ipomoea batatas]
MGNFGWNYAALIFLVVSCFFAWETIASTTTEAEALLKWKSGLSSSSLKSWSLSNLTNLCNWRGIVCNGDGAVSEINLPNADLYGTLHHLNFTSFPSLTGFNITGNSFNGSIPPAIGDLSNLVFLDLSYNRFDGSIPPQIGNLTELQHLDLSANYFISGVIPHQIGNLQKVCFLDFGAIFLANAFFAWETIASTTTEAEALLKWKSGLSSSSLKSWSLSNLTPLVIGGALSAMVMELFSEINLPNADLYGTLHHLNFTSFPSLTGFNITGNSFNGSIPPAIGDLSNLVFLDLSYNRFDGSIPPQIGNLTELQHLDLSANYFISGVIPHQIGNLQKVCFLDFGYSPSLDASDWSSKVKSFPMLTHFSFYGGELVSFPDFILCSRNLTYLHLSGIHLNGSIPESLFTNLEKLEYLDLSYNNFSGPLSPNINNLSNLKDLILSHNQFQGEIPYSIGQLKDLQVLDISQNLLNEIPYSIGQLKDLQVLDISQNLLNSTIPSSLSSLTKLSILELSSNLFSGNISPHLFSNWTKLTHLGLADNSFVGSIPSEIGQARQTKILHQLTW